MTGLQPGPRPSVSVIAQRTTINRARANQMPAAARTHFIPICICANKFLLVEARTSYWSPGRENRPALFTTCNGLTTLVCLLPGRKHTGLMSPEGHCSLAQNLNLF